jgi:hypothetical protein
VKLNTVIVNIRPRLTKAMDGVPTRVIHRITLDYFHDEHPGALDEIIDIMGEEGVTNIERRQIKLKLEKADGGKV